MHPFFLLREKLPALQFDPLMDAEVSRQEWLKKYLQFYQLEFSAEICSNHVAGTFEAANYVIAAHYWIPACENPKGTIFILHGYYDHVGLFRHVIQCVLEQGFIVVAYDQPGHGLSSGEQASIKHFSEYVTVLDTCLKKCLNNSEHFPKPWYGLGQSTGGAVLLHALMLEKITNPFRGIVLLAPLINPGGWKKGIWTYRLLHPFINKIPRHFSNNSNDPDFVAFCQNQDPLQSRYLSVKWVGAMKEWLDIFPTLDVINIPALLIQGEADTTVDWRRNVPLLQQKLCALEYCLLPMARHHLVNESASLRQQIFTRIQQFLLAS